VLRVAPESFEVPPETLPGSLRSLLRGVYKLPDRLLIELDPERVLDLTGDPAGG
jgi:chemotaxis signal transduction protein